MRITMCGTRGSTPAPGRDFVRYGGHTSCVAVSPPGAVAPELILDAGTGIRNVTPLLAGGMSPPHFPITPRQLRGQWEFIGIEPGIVRLGALTLLAREIPHKGGRTFGYHHRPDRSDSELEKLATGLRDSPVPVALAADGEVICL